MAGREPSWVRVCVGLSWILAAASPFVLYYSITYARLEDAAALLLAFAVLKAVPAFLGAKREQRVAALRLPAVAVVSAAAGVLAREPRMLLVLPSASQLAFGAVFLSSLRSTPLVEHFARMRSPTLGPARVRYCRNVTMVWGVTLCAAALGGLVLAFFAPLAVWTAFTGVGSYVLVALLFSGEFVVRKARFRDYGSGPLDRLMAMFFPPPETTTQLPIESQSESRARVTLPAGYVFFRGHFDGMPILPGIVQITEIVMPLVRKRWPECRTLVAIRRLRFRRPVQPGETIEVELEGEAPKDVRFHLKVGATRVASGTLSWET